MHTPKEFIEANKNNKLPRQVNLTPQQIYFIEQLAEINDVPFEDMAMAMMQSQLTSLGDREAEELAKRN